MQTPRLGGGDRRQKHHPSICTTPRQGRAPPSSGQGVADAIKAAMVGAGVPEAQARSAFYFVDSKGVLLHRGRSSKGSSMISQCGFVPAFVLSTQSYPHSNVLSPAPCHSIGYIEYNLRRGSRPTHPAPLISMPSLAGLVTTTRGDRLPAYKVAYARTDLPPIASLRQIIRTVQPTALVWLPPAMGAGVSLCCCGWARGRMTGSGTGYRCLCWYLHMCACVCAWFHAHERVRARVCCVRHFGVDRRLASPPSPMRSPRTSLWRWRSSIAGVRRTHRRVLSLPLTQTHHLRALQSDL